MYRDEEQRDFARQMRNQPTEAEKRLWDFLRADQLKVKFRRQAAIGPYIADFVCFSHKLIVELDGPQHVEEQGKLHDERRTAWLTTRGFRVMRFRNQALDEDAWLVVEEIKQVLTEQSAALGSPPPQPSPQGGGSKTGVIYDAASVPSGGQSARSFRSILNRRHCHNSKNLSAKHQNSFRTLDRC